MKERYKLYGTIKPCTLFGEKALDLGWFGFTHYLVTETGKVWSIRREKFLCTSKDRRGYTRISLKTYVNGTPKLITVRVHRLVAMAFLKNPENKKQVNHIDGNKDNNTVENLEWATNLENAVRSRINGLMPNAVFTEEDVHRICKALQKGVKMRIIADKYGYPYRAVQAIKLGRNWTHVSDKYDIAPAPNRIQLSSRDIDEIIRLLKNREVSRSDIATSFGIDVSTVHKIFKRFCK